MRIQLAYDTKVNGRKRKADSIVEVSGAEARMLINKGLARPAAKEEKAANTNSKEDVTE